MSGTIAHGTIQSGTYTISNIATTGFATLASDGNGVAITQSKDNGNDTIKFTVTKLPNGNYTILGYVYTNYAAVGSPPKKGEDAPPKKGEDSPPKKGEDAPPKKGEDSPSKDSPPKKGEDFSPKKGEVSSPKKGEDVKARSSAYEWQIKETNTKRQYLISPNDDDFLYWGFSGSSATNVKLTDSGSSTWQFTHIRD
ncbi:hypothetical protein BV22DRAFT_1037673 [Leucogyrophana mollusca]|uniref:Uncharacterized protein n=1 Tax=Leucogyrophana mollusca TaxID=85980 RepID=A0ACB8BAF7_9AGAM|nr:hypothetical protein BV22DRAFT_1037673 [Leucogyrophana mollusca]